MNKNTNLIKSFKNAFCGIFSALKLEKNLRFHFVISNLIILFAYFYKLSRAEWAILLLTITLVFCSELINTAVENAVDTATTQYKETAKIAKDVCAGAVLFSAIISIGVGFLLFFDTQKIASTLTYIFTTPKALIPCLIIGVFDILFYVFFGRKKIRL